MVGRGGADAVAILVPPAPGWAGLRFWAGPGGIRQLSGLFSLRIDDFTFDLFYLLYILLMDLFYFILLYIYC